MVKPKLMGTDGKKLLLRSNIHIFFKSYVKDGYIE